MRKSVEFLDEPKSLEPIEAEDIAAVIRWAKSAIRRGAGIVDGTTDVSAPIMRHVPPTVMVWTDEDVPVYSIFGITGGAPLDAVPKMRIAKVGTSVPYLVATNGGDPWKAQTWNHARVIAGDDPVVLTCASADEVPKVGEHCGVKHGTYRLTNDGIGGLICCSPPSDAHRIWVVRAREPIAVYGQVVETITKFNPTACEGHGRLGKGRIRVYYRQGGGNCLTLAPAPWTAKTAGSEALDDEAPEPQRFEIDVFNTTQKEYSEGTQLRATDTLGIGLTVDSASIDTSSSSSSSGSDSDGSEGSEGSGGSGGSGSGSGSGCPDEMPIYDGSYPIYVIGYGPDGCPVKIVQCGQGSGS